MINVEEIVERYKGYFEHLNAAIYSGKPDESVKMIHWWCELQETNDIHNLVYDDVHPLPNFINLFTPPTYMIYSLSSTTDRFDNVAWFTPANEHFLTQAAYGALWTNIETRGKPKQLEFADRIYCFAFEIFDAIIGTTWQSGLLKVHEKMGYKIVGAIPNLNGKDLIYIVHLTRNDFYNSRMHHAAERWL